MIEPVRHTIRRRALAITLALLATLGVPEYSRAAEARPTVPTPGLGMTRVIRAGDVVDIRWADPGPDAREMELLLSLDGGRHYAVRVSPELDRGSTHFAWRVPKLASGEARLMLRMRIDEREVESAPSQPFAIELVPDERTELEVVHEDAWWSGPHPAWPTLPSGLVAGESSTLSASQAPWAAEHTPRGLLPAPAHSGVAVAVSSTVAGPHRERIPCAPTTRCTPLLM